MPWGGALHPDLQEARPPGEIRRQHVEVPPKASSCLPGSSTPTPAPAAPASAPPLSPWQTKLSRNRSFGRDSRGWVDDSASEANPFCPRCLILAHIPFSCFLVFRILNEESETHKNERYLHFSIYWIAEQCSISFILFSETGSPVAQAGLKFTL